MCIVPFRLCVMLDIFFITWHVQHNIITATGMHLTVNMYYDEFITKRLHIVGYKMIW